MVGENPWFHLGHAKFEVLLNVYSEISSGSLAL